MSVDQTTQSLTATATATVPREPSTRSDIRGSSLLLGGRLISKFTNFGIQIAIVRGLTRDSFGAFAYAMALVTIGQVIVMCGMSRAMPRFLPIYRQQGDMKRFYGALSICIGCVLIFGTVVVAGVLLAAPYAEGTLVRSPTSLSCLLVLIFVAPLQAVDDIVIAMLAMFGAAKKIFLRKHVLNPVLKVVAVGSVLLAGGTIEQLCFAYLIAVAIGVGISFWLLGPVAESEGVSLALHRQEIDYPFRELMAFALPLMTSELLLIAVGTMDAIMLEQLRGTSEVAGLRAVFKIAVLNQLVAHSFTSLYLPTASRAFARNDKAAINTGYWQTAVWIAVLTFPVFALSCMGARSVVETAYGERYADAPILLTLLAFGCYIDSMFGFNALTLKVYGRMRYMLGINAVAAVFAVSINLLLIPPYGATGAAVGTLLTMLLLFVLKHVGLWRLTEVAPFARKLLVVYTLIGVFSLAIAAFNYWLNPSLWTNMFVVAGFTVALLAASRNAMQIDETFPELKRIPILGPLFARSSS
ncbi:MAG: oligosaccharide flippase family protein [Planctomycetaceae bacterium]